MQAVTQPMPTGETQPPERTAITTTLFDLIAALHEEVGPDEEELVTAAVVHLCTSGRLRFLGTPTDYEVPCQMVINACLCVEPRNDATTSRAVRYSFRAACASSGRSDTLPYRGNHAT